jgi:hypothetical protein
LAEGEREKPADLPSLDAISRRGVGGLFSGKQIAVMVGQVKENGMQSTVFRSNMLGK